MPKRLCNCKKKRHKKVASANFANFELVEWLKKRTPQHRLIDRTVKLKYFIHPAEMQEHLSVKKVFARFDDDGNSIFF